MYKNGQTVKKYQKSNKHYKSKKYSKDEHNIVMASVKPSDVLIYIYSEPTQLVLLKGVIKDVDLDSDSIYDIRLRYDGIDSETEYGIFLYLRRDSIFCVYGDPTLPNTFIGSVIRFYPIGFPASSPSLIAF